MTKARILYQLTDADLQKAAKFAASATDRKDRVEAKPSSNKKVQAAKRRAASMEALKGNPEYYRGIWQGRIDNARGFAYTEERTESAFNLGYYRGYTDLERDLKGGVVIPEQYLA